MLLQIALQAKGHIVLQNALHLELSGTECVGEGYSGFQWLHGWLSLGKQRSYVGEFLWPQLKGGVHYILFIEGILMKLCDSEPGHLSETELPSSVKQCLFAKHNIYTETRSCERESNLNVFPVET